jgi:hypothetical protein
LRKDYTCYPYQPAVLGFSRHCGCQLSEADERVEWGSRVEGKSRALKHIYTHWTSDGRTTSSWRALLSFNELPLFKMIVHRFRFSPKGSVDGAPVCAVQQQHPQPTLQLASLYPRRGRGRTVLGPVQAMLCSCASIFGSKGVSSTQINPEVSLRLHQQTKSGLRSRAD